MKRAAKCSSARVLIFTLVESKRARFIYQLQFSLIFRRNPNLCVVMRVSRHVGKHIYSLQSQPMLLSKPINYLAQLFSLLFRRSFHSLTSIARSHFLSLFLSSLLMFAARAQLMCFILSLSVRHKNGKHTTGQFL